MGFTKSGVIQIKRPIISLSIGLLIVSCLDLSCSQSPTDMPPKETTTVAHDLANCMLIGQSKPHCCKL